MYRGIIRPFLFCFSPESIHHFIVRLLKIVTAIPGGKSLMRGLYSYKHPSLEREVFGVKFQNPIGMAAGFDKNGEIYEGLSCMGFGFVEIGTVTPESQPGNKPPRLFRLPSDKALINRMGFNNKGLSSMLDNLRKRNPNIIVGANLGKNTSTLNSEAGDDYLKTFRSLYNYADYFVINVSCPNVKGVSLLQSRAELVPILERLFDFRRGQSLYRPIMLKISPDLTNPQLDEMVETLVTTDLDGIVAVNTTTSRENLKTGSKRLSKIGDGGLSGAPITERAIEVVSYISEKTQRRYPIIGVGGVMTPEDAQRMLDAGASLVQLYTGFIYNGPSFVRKVCKHLKKAHDSEAKGGESV